MSTVEEEDHDSLLEYHHLMKLRCKDPLKGELSREILQETNILLQENLPTRYLKNIETSINEVLKNDKPSEKIEKVWEGVRIRVETVFYAFYQTQATEDEVMAILNLVHKLSDLLISKDESKLSKSNTDSSPMELYSQPIFYTLTILQLTLVCSLQQTSYLLTRNSELSDAQINATEIGNNIKQIPGSRYDLDKQVWKCTGAKAFTCMAFAVFRQPEVDLDRAEAADVEWFLHEACLLRGYSYIRLCIIPALRIATMQSPELGLFLFSVLAELLENLAHIFCLMCYQDINSSNEKHFNYYFFPPTQSFYLSNLDFYETIAIEDNHYGSQEADLSNRSGLSATAASFSFLGKRERKEEAQVRPVDSLEDVTNLFTEMMTIYPQFARVFWPGLTNIEFEDEEPREREIDANFEHLQSDTYHPFAIRLVEASVHFYQLVIPAMNFFACAASSPGYSTARATYIFLLRSQHRIINWESIFDKLNTLTAQFLPQQELQTQIPWGSVYNELPLRTQQTQKPQLTALDIEGLDVIVKLIGSVAKDVNVAYTLNQTFQVVSRFFTLLSCPLPIELKGSIMRALTSFAETSHHSIGREIWENIDHANLLPGLSAFSFGANSVAVHSHGGIRSELEDVEGRLGKYYLTDSFLALMLALVQHHPVPNDLGATERIPGIIVYLEFIVQDVLLKVEDRIYYPDWKPSILAQKWKLIARVMEILAGILISYPVHSADTEESALSDFIDEMEILKTRNSQTVKFIKPKSAGFHVMSTVLRHSKLTEFIIKFLQSTNAELMDERVAVYASAEISQTIEDLRTWFQNIHTKSMQQQQQSLAGRNKFAFRGKFSDVAGQDEEVFSLARQSANLSQVTQRDAAECDLVYWMERSVTSTLAFVHEIALRCDTFASLCMQTMNNAGNTHSTLTTYILENGRLVAAPVVVHNFSQVLVGYQFSATLAQLICLRPRTLTSSPTMAVLAMKLLEFLSVHQPVASLLWQTPQDRERSATSTTSSVSVEQFLGFLAQLLRTATDRHDDEIALDVLNSAGEYVITHLGAERERFPQYFTPAKSFVWNPLLRSQLLWRKKHRMRLATESAREALLQLLLVSLSPHTTVLSHVLLLGNQPLQSPRLLSPPRDMQYADCLDALLQMLNPDPAHATIFFEQYPEKAVDCYELICRLTQTKSLQDLVLHRLREKRANYFSTHLTFLLYWMHLRAEDLQQLEHTRSGKLSTLDYQYAVGQSMAWLLKTCAQELHLSFAVRGGSRSAVSLVCSAQQILQLLFGPCRALAFAAERADDLLAVAKIAQFVSELSCEESGLSRPAESVSALSFSPDLLAMLRAHSFTQQAFKAGVAFQQSVGYRAGPGNALSGAGNPFASIEQSVFAAPHFVSVDVDACISSANALIAECAKVSSEEVPGKSTAVTRQQILAQRKQFAAEVELAVPAVVQMNESTKLKAAACHLSLAWSQLTSLAMTAPTTQVESNDQIDALLSARALFTELLLPALNAARDLLSLGSFAAEQKLRTLVAIAHRCSSTAKQHQQQQQQHLLPSDEDLHALFLGVLELFAALSQKQDILSGGDVGGLAGAGLESKQMINKNSNAMRTVEGLACLLLKIAFELVQSLSLGRDRPATPAAGLTVNSTRNTQSPGEELQNAIERNALLLAESVAALATNRATPVVWRVVALSALSTLFEILAQWQSQAQDSPGYSQGFSQGYSQRYSSMTISFRSQMLVTAVIQALSAKGFFLRLAEDLRDILGSAVYQRSYRSGAGQESAGEEEFLQALLATLSKCISSYEGMQAIRAAKLFWPLASAVRYTEHPPLPTDLFCTSAQQPQLAVTLQSYYLGLDACVQFLLALLACANCVRDHHDRDRDESVATDVLDCAQTFIRNHQSSLLSLVRFQGVAMNAQTLRLAEHTTALFSAVTACYTTIPQLPLQVQPPRSERQTDSRTENVAVDDATLRACFNWIRQMASSPLPERFLKGLHLQGLRAEQDNSWWEGIARSCEVVPRNPPSGATLSSADLSDDSAAAERRQVLMVLRIANNVSGLVRSQLLQQLSASSRLPALVQSLDFEALRRCFCNSFRIVEQLSAQSIASELSSTTTTFLAELLHCFRVLMEDSLTTIYYLLTLPLFQSTMLPTKLVQDGLTEVMLIIQRVLQGDADETSAYLATTGRWIQDQLFRIQYQYQTPQ